MSDITERVVDTIIVDILRNLPNQILAAYASPPGRKPGPDLIQISKSIKKLDPDEVLRLIRNVADVTLFSVLYLIDVNFKEANIETVFRNASNSVQSANLLEKYRQKVDPGGEIIG